MANAIGAGGGGIVPIGLAGPSRRAGSLSNTLEQMWAGFVLRLDCARELDRGCR